MNEKNPTLCIVAGPNGSGKTSTTVQLLHNEWAENSLYINPDNIAQEQYGDWNSPVAVLKAAELATKMRYECLRKRQDFVFETVFSSDEKLAFVEEAKKAGLTTFRCNSHLEMANAYSDIREKGDVILVKGSRGLRMERVVEELKDRE